MANGVINVNEEIMWEVLVTPISNPFLDKYYR